MIHDKEMLLQIYNNAGRSCECIKNLLPNVNDEKLKEQLNFQLGGYESFVSVAGENLKKLGVESTCSGVSPRHYYNSNSPAATVISNTVAELEQLKNCIDSYRKSDYDRDIVDLANDTAMFNSKNIDRMRRFC